MAEINQERCLELIKSIATQTQVIPQTVSFSSFRFHGSHIPIGIFNLSNSPVGIEILNLKRADQASLVMAMLDWCTNPQNIDLYPAQITLPDWYMPRRINPNPNQESCFGFYGVSQAMLQLMNRRLPFKYGDICRLLGYIISDPIFFDLDWQSHQDGVLRLVKILENYLQNNPPDTKLVEQIESFIDYLTPKRERKLIARLQALIPLDAQPLPIYLGETWADAAIAELDAMPKDVELTWLELLMLCATAKGSKPSTKWLKSTQPLVAQLGWENFSQALVRWFPLVDIPHTQPEDVENGNSRKYYLLIEENADILKGLVWLCAQQEDADLARALMQLAVAAYRKLPSYGIRCVRLGNACVWALGQMPGQTAIAQLSLLKVKVKFGSAQIGIEKAITAVAERIGIDRSTIEELAVPTYGLESVGLRRETLGDFVAELAVTGTNSTELRWLKADGKSQKSIPAVVKNDYGEDLKELKQAAKDMQTMLPAQRDRLESLYLQQKTWDLATWKERYLNHPLVGTLARRLIWQFQEDHHCIEGIWLHDRLVSYDDHPLDWLSDRTQVQLWHPISATPETILAWRNWLITHKIQQPYKQAHREVYLLTPAEENTHNYSNRFAAHILKQHQFNALCGQRGWKNQLRLMVDSGYSPPTRSLPNWGLRAEFWVEGIGDTYGTDTNETGTYLYLATDQVRFYPLEAAENHAHALGGGYQMHGNILDPIPLENIPALVFTEIMRDVDLFVGVASVGNDPNWADGSMTGDNYDYWQNYSFGDLSETAKTRRQVLETLIPRLKIRDRCHFQDKFLVVRGDLRTYKIHLGSGNILMEPNAQYLCIVPAQENRATPSPVFLPFEGDKVMAIVLSKALMLAADAKITDPTILAQIKSR